MTLIWQDSADIHCAARIAHYAQAALRTLGFKIGYNQQPQATNKELGVRGGHLMGQPQW